jgi:hypothetical protein
MFYQVSKEDDYLFKGKRKRLVETLKQKGIKNKQVLDAIEKIPRHLFFDDSTARPALLDHAYSDKALPIGAGQTISHPYTVAFQTEQLDIKQGEKVLEIARKIKDAREKNIFNCPAGEKGCCACRPFEKILKGEAEFIGIGGYGQEMYLVL